MKYVFALLMFFSLSTYAQESCNPNIVGCKIENQDVNTPVPKDLEDAEIIIRTKDGKEQKVSANDFKVVKRKQQFKVKDRVLYVQGPERLVEKRVEVKAKENKNIIMLGVAYDRTGLESKVSGNKATLYSEKGPVVDVSYFRRRVLDTNFGLGLGLNTNEAPRVMLGLEF